MYYFNVNGKKFSGSGEGSLNSERMYFIKFYPPDPTRNEATFIIADSNDLKNLPAAGYSILPHK